MSLYQERLLTEGIRIIENKQPSDNFSANYNNLNFEETLFKRTELADLRYQASPIFKHCEQLFKLFLYLICGLFFIIGVTSASQLLINDKGTQINFFRALILFILPNIISLFIWIGLYFNARLLSNGWFAHLCLSFIALLDKFQHKINAKNPHYLVLFKYYFEHRLDSYMGRIQLSFISHIGWSSYLFGAFLSVVVLLATHQVDFVWETTILNEHVFLKLTEILTYLPHLLSISVPNAIDVSHADISVTNSLQAAQSMRINWSNLLMFSLVIYALLPRLIFSIYFNQRINNYKKHFRPNYSLPYYVQLKSMLNPLANTSFIKDAYDETINTSPSSKERLAISLDTKYPDQSFPLAIELSPSYYQQAKSQLPTEYATTFINILDRESQEAALSQVLTVVPDDIVIYVDVMRTPDRGWQGLMKKFYYKSDVTIYLIFIAKDMPENDELITSRLESWLDVAAQINIAPKNMSYMIND